MPRTIERQQTLATMVTLGIIASIFVPFHGGNRGSNPPGRANEINYLTTSVAGGCNLGMPIWPKSTPPATPRK
jgi:hypothetical protein